MSPSSWLRSSSIPWSRASPGSPSTHLSLQAAGVSLSLLFHCILLLLLFLLLIVVCSPCFYLLHMFSVFYWKKFAQGPLSTPHAGCGCVTRDLNRPSMTWSDLNRPP